MVSDEQKSAWMDHAEVVRLQFQEYVEAGFSEEVAVQFCVATLSRSVAAESPELSEFLTKASMQIERGLEE